MLECNRFAFLEHKQIRSSVQTQSIRDADSGEVVGFTREKSGSWPKLLCWLTGKHRSSITIDVYEKPDDSLVFTLHRSWFLFKVYPIEVRDSLGQLVGFIKSHDGFDIYEKDGNHFAHVTGNLFDFNYRFLTEDGKVELGRVAKEASADTYYLEVNPDLADQPLAKMLLLGATLAVDLIYIAVGHPM